MANKNSRRNAREKSNKKDRFVKFGIVVLIIIFIFVIYKIFDLVVTNSQKIELSGNNYYQYFYGIRTEYSGEIELVKNENAKQLILEDGKVVHLDSTPIYYKDILGKVLLPEKMAVVFYNESRLSKLEEFSNILEDSYIMYAKRFKKDETKRLDKAFLYDGKDMYFFLEETTINVGKQKYEVSPFSYAIVNYKLNVEIYDYEKDEYIIVDEKIVEETNNVTATNKDKTCKINMAIDSFSTGVSDQLLIKDIDYLKELDY